MGVTTLSEPLMSSEQDAASHLLGNYDHFFNDSDYPLDIDLDLMLMEMEQGRSGIVQRRLTYYLMGIAGSIVCCLGTIANALSVAVLTRRAMRSSTYMYLAALAICDSLVLFFTLLIILKDTQPPGSPQHYNQFNAILFPYIHPTAVVFQVTSIWLTLGFTVDRYIMICHPFKAERMCRRSRARKVVIGLYIGGLLFNIPRYLQYHTKIDTVRLANDSQVYTVYGVEQTKLGQEELFREIIHSWLYLICVCGIPFLTLVILNAFLIRAVHMSRLKGKEINAREKHRNDTTIMLIGVIIIFLICQGPALVSNMLYAFKPGSSMAVYTLNEVGSFLVILNSAINIVPYYMFGRKFRSEFWRLFCTCFFDQDELRRIVRSYSLSMDQRRMSQYNVMEMNGMGQNNVNNNQNNNDNGGGGNCGEVTDRSHRSYNRHPGQPPDCRITICKSDTADSVAVPLIHSTCNSVSSNGLSNRDSSKDSLRTCSSSQPLSPSGNRTVSNGHVQYMTVTASPCVKEPEWSAV